MLYAASAGRVQADQNSSQHNHQNNNASVAAARRRFASSAIDDMADGNNNNNNDSVSNTSYATSPATTPRSGNVRGARDLSMVTSISSSSGSRKRADASGSGSRPRAANNNNNAAAPTHLTDAQMALVNNRGACTSILYPTSSSAHAAAAAAGGREDWTTNLYREFRPNAVIRAAESFEKSLTVNSVETRLHALRSLYHCACDGAACRAALRQKLPKMVSAVAAVACEADATRQGGNRLCDMAFRLVAVMLHDDERFDTDAALDDTLMAVVAPRCLLAGGDAAFGAATLLRRVSEIGGIAHAIVHNDILLDGILRVLEEESLWFQEQQHRSLQQAGSPTGKNVSTAATSSSAGNNNHQQHVEGGEAVTVECAATVIQLRIALLNVCSRPTAATFLLVKSQRFVSLLARDAEMGVWASRGLLQKNKNDGPATSSPNNNNNNSNSNGGAEAAVAFGDRTLSQEAVIYAAAQAHNGKTQPIAGAVLEERLTLELANGKRRLFQPSHVVTFALAGTVFDSAASDTEALSSLPSHPSVPSEGGSAIPASRAAHSSSQPLQCRLEASRIVRGEEVAVLAAVSAVLSLRTLHAMTVREGRSEAMMAVQGQMIRALTSCLAHVGAGGAAAASTNNNNNSASRGEYRSASKSSLESAACVSGGGGDAAARLLANLRMAAAAAIDVLEEADSENVVRRLENFQSEGKAIVDKLRSNLYDHPTN